MGVYTQTPNFFKYATNELSQDAFLCWALEGLNYNGGTEPKSSLNNFSKAFFKLILSKWNEFGDARRPRVNCQYNADEIKSVEIFQQKYKIDVLAIITLSNGYGESILPIIIEDKTFTSIHDNQLFRYRNEFNKNKDIYGKKCIEPICIYYRNGYPFYDKAVAEANGYACIFIEDMLQVMSRFYNKISSDIFNGYYEYLCIVKARDDIPLKNLKDLEFDEASKSDIGQFAMMERLVAKNNFITYKPSNGEDAPIIIPNIEMGSNSGFHWTTYTILFAEYYERVKDGTIPANQSYKDCIYYRIDEGTQVLSFRQYNNQSVVGKAERLAFLQECLKASISKAEEIDNIPIAHLFSFKKRKNTKDSIIADINLKNISKDDFQHLTGLLTNVNFFFRELITQ